MNSWQNDLLKITFHVQGTKRSNYAIFYNYKKKQSNLLTTEVHSEIQKPLSVKLVCRGGIAILSIYSRPSSITAASCVLNFFASSTFNPELSIQSVI